MKTTTTAQLLSLNVKSVASAIELSELQLDALHQEQLQLEIKYSRKVFKNKVSKFVSSIDISSLDELFMDYIGKLASISDDKIKPELRASHCGLLAGNKNTKAKWFKELFTLVLTEKYTSKSYIDLDHIALQLGRNLANKEHRGDTSVMLSLGLNIVYFFNHIGLCKIDYILNKENHRINRITTHIDSAELDSDGKHVRANAPMLVKPLPYSPLNINGGYILDRGLMLNGKEVVHSTDVYTAVNYLQETPYRLRNEPELLSKWFSTERFYTDTLVELKKEKHKVLNDFDTYLGRDIYFPIGADHRGRLYSKSTYINYQGDEYQKSLLEFADKVILTDEDMDELRVAISNEIYTDKCTREEAINWFNMNQHSMQALVGKSVAGKILYKDYIRAMQGLPVGTIVHQDMTNSGLGIYSLLGRDELGASLTNIKAIVEDGKVKLADAYDTLAKALNHVLNITNLNRSTVKKAFMVFLYGSGKALLKSGDIEDTRYKTLLDAINAEITIQIDIDQAWEAFSKAMESIAPAAIKLMKLIYMFKDDSCEYQWNTQDGFVIKKTVMDKSGENNGTLYKGFALTPDGKNHSGTVKVLEKLTSAKYDKSLAPDVVHGDDASIVRAVARKCKARNIPLCTIHDSFGTRPNDCKALRGIVREVAVEMLQANLLEGTLMQINYEKYLIAKEKGLFIKGNLTAQDILESENIVR